jgi:hypothetical protein
MVSVFIPLDDVDKMIQKWGYPYTLLSDKDENGVKNITQRRWFRHMYY